MIGHDARRRTARITYPVARRAATAATTGMALVPVLARLLPPLPDGVLAEVPGAGTSVGVGVGVGSSVGVGVGVGSSVGVGV